MEEKVEKNVLNLKFIFNIIDTTNFCLKPCQLFYRSKTQKHKLDVKYVGGKKKFEICKELFL